MLVVCKECGNDVADSAPVCPKCGVPNPAGKTCKLNVSRKKGITGFASVVQVYIDESGDYIRNGESFDVELSPGEHEIKAYSSLPDAVRICSFEVHSGESIDFECGFGFVGGFYLKEL